MNDPTCQRCEHFTGEHGDDGCWCGCTVPFAAFLVAPADTTEEPTDG